MKIISADERLKQQTGVKMAIYCNFSKYKCIFIDSITMVSKICLGWAHAQVEQSKKSDTRAAYSLLANEMLA
jgi:hypothetical protein